MGLTLYFLRHGQTDYSITGGYCGTPENDPGLTAAGMEMAQAFAEVYQHLPWRAAFVSPLRRAIQTAKPLCETVGMQMQLRDGLKEIAYGEWEGLHPQVVNQKFHDEYVQWLTDPAWNGPAGGERAVDIAHRSSRVIEEIEEKYAAGCILVVSHKATIRIMLCELLGIDVGRYRDRFDMPVAAVSIVEFTRRGPLFHAIALRSHLGEHLRSLPST
ncbi:MAG: histidine phosphatase family protein [Gomphosphaeria aponina SAG 52.96 = DSM 107014]|uniref:Histidine phosphatase family protein n=1 Tax=Gomphosphaeria aponina SAG 52.96 = DSM 107014 TaxID=1521640 RepID=A0A941GPP9_9CHRO|nr:histidine phosphatase family protein [Gomphosphaeria aponina SAG 52.96 = DSM 107014]